MSVVDNRFRLFADTYLSIRALLLPRADHALTHTVLICCCPLARSTVVRHTLTIDKIVARREKLVEFSESKAEGR